MRMDLSKTRQFPALLVLVLITAAAAAIGSLATVESLPVWYPALAKPAWNPPAWVFGPVWTVLYLMMAVAAWLVWLRREECEVVPALGAYLLQLTLNACWSLIFFGLHEPGWAFGEIVVLWVAIAITLRAFWRVTPAAGWLFVPYLAWVTFAAVLNFTLWRMNG
jgi:tryptophan-rich sensory protein